MDTKNSKIKEKAYNVEDAVRDLIKTVTQVREADKTHLAGLTQALQSRNKQIAAMREAGKTDLEEAEAKYKDLSLTFDSWLNEVWSIVYPQDPTGWEYPAQVFRHIRDFVAEKNTLIQEREERNKELEGSLATVRSTLGKATESFEAIELIAEETLKASYDNSNFPGSIEKHYYAKTDLLRGALMRIGTKAKTALNSKTVVTATVNADTKAKPIRENDTKPPMGGSYTVGVDKAAPGGDFTAINILDLAKKLERDITDSFRIPRSMFGLEGEGILPKRGDTYPASIGYTVKDDKLDVFSVSPLLGLPIRYSRFMPEDLLAIIGGNQIVCGMLSKNMRDARLKALQAEQERQERIAKQVKDLLKPKAGVTINITVKPSKIFEEYAERIRAIGDKAQADINDEVNSLLGRCKE